MIFRLVSATAAAALFATASSAATFNSDEADFRLTATGVGVALDQTAVIGSGVEANFNNTIELDISGLTVDITYDLTGVASVGADTQWTVTGLDAIGGGAISALRLTGGNSRLVDSIAFTADSLTFNFFDFTSAQSPGRQTWSFEVSTLVSVPVPASLPLLVLGFGALGAMARRRKAA